jgi:membrane associated rhomboid family serine protease
MGNEEDSTVPPSLSDVGAAFRALWTQSAHNVSLLIVWVSVGLFLTVAVLGAFGIVPRDTLVSFLGLSRTGVLEHRLLYQFVTAPLLHPTVTHLLFNMLALWMLGPSVEQAMGRRRYILFSLVCALGSMLGFLFLSRDPRALVMGYSGVIFGILVAQAVYFPNNRLMFFLFFPMKMKHAVLILAAVELYLTVSPEKAGVAHSAHLFGALAAFVFVRFSQRQDAHGRPREGSVGGESRPRRPRRERCQRIPKQL